MTDSPTGTQPPEHLVPSHHTPPADHLADPAPDRPTDSALDRLIALTAQTLHAPIALLSTADGDRVILKSCFGLPEPSAVRSEMPPLDPFCRDVVASGRPRLIDDVRADSAVPGGGRLPESRALAYAGVPLLTPRGTVLGSFCVMDTNPRRWTERDIGILTGLAAAAMAEIEPRTEFGARHRAGSLRREVDLRASDAFLNTILATTEAAIFIKDRAGRYILANEGTARILGLPVAQLLGKTAHDVQPPEVAAKLHANDLRVMASGVTERAEEIIVHDGVQRTFLSTKSLYRDATGAPVGVIGVATDITDRKQVEAQLEIANQNLGDQAAELEMQAEELQTAAEELNRQQTALEEALTQLQASETRFRSLAEACPVGIFRADLSGRYLYANQRWCELSGLSPAEALGDGWQRGIHPEDRERVIDERRKAFAVGAPLRLEYRFARPDGTVVWVYGHLSAERDASGQLTGYVGTTTDITDRKRAEAALANAQRMEAIGRLAGGVAHEANNQMTVVLGCAAFGLKHPAIPDPVRSEIEQIQRAAERTAAITRQLLAFSRRQVLRPATLDFNVVVQDLEPVLRRALGKDSDLLPQLSPGIAPVFADRGQLEQVLINLVLNARDAMPAGGLVTIQTDDAVLTEADPGIAADSGEQMSPGRYAVLVVSDTGEGIDAHTLPRIFEPFFTTKPFGQGTGLGLATAYGIVRQMRGWIGVASAPGQGTVFRVYLPVAEPAAAAGDVTPAPERRSSETVLIVEDEPSVRELLVRSLTSAGFNILEAKDGAEAITVLASQTSPVHALVADVAMPLLGGPDLVARLGRSRPTLPVLFISGCTEEELAHRGLDLGGHLLLQKPFRPDELVATLRALLDASGENARHFAMNAVPQ
jgi:two-component system cell cycle sensor histidine kinase/response regulator CckA